MSIMGYNTNNENCRGDPGGRPVRRTGDPRGRPAYQRGDHEGRPAGPYCGSTDTELFSLFGQQLLTVQYYCNACHTPFECIKDDAILDEYAAQSRSSDRE